MPRKPEPSFSLKQIVWDIAATVSTENMAAISRQVDETLRQRQQKGELFEDQTPDIRTLRRIIKIDINRLALKVVVAKLPPHVWHLRNDYESIERFVASFKAKKEAVIEQELYEETPHKRQMRELAKALAGEISLPSLWDRDLWRDLPVEFHSGNYSLPIGVVEVGKDKQIKVNYYDVCAHFAAPHLVNGLYSHLNTSGLSKFAELVGDKGKFDNWVDVVGQYSQALLTFLMLITDEVKGYRAKVNFHDEIKPGLTKWFIVTAWNDALQKAGDFSWIDDSWYKPHESIPGTNLWQLRCGTYSIGIAKCERTLKTYKKWHKNLRAKYAQHPLAKDIDSKSQDLNNIAQDIRQRLQEFSDIQYLPGNCELC